MRRLPSLAAVEAFVQVARLGSIKVAAEELALSSPALSRRIQTLERFIGRPLFERRHQAIVPNEDGEKLLALTAPLLDSLSDAIETMTSAQPVLRLRLGVAPLFASQRLIPALPSLRERFPALHLDIDTAAHSLTRLGEGLDVAITLARDVDEALYSHPLGRNIIFPIGARRLTQGPHAINDPRQIKEMTVFTHRDMPDLYEEWAASVGIKGLEPAAIDHFDSGQLMLEAAAQGLGIAFLHESHLNDAHDERLIKLFEPEIESPYIYWFACRPRALTHKPVKIFHDWLLAREIAV